MNAAREIMASENVQELFSRQVQYLQTSFQVQSEFSSVSAIVSDVAKASVSPITERVDLFAKSSSNQPTHRVVCAERSFAWSSAHCRSTVCMPRMAA